MPNQGAGNEFCCEDLVRWIPKLCCYLFCIYEACHGRMTVGTILAYSMLLDQISKPMEISRVGLLLSESTVFL